MNEAIPQQSMQQGLKPTLILGLIGPAKAVPLLQSDLRLVFPQPQETGGTTGDQRLLYNWRPAAALQLETGGTTGDGDLRLLIVRAQQIRQALNWLPVRVLTAEARRPSATLFLATLQAAAHTTKLKLRSRRS